MPVLDLTGRRPQSELEKLPLPANAGLAGLFAGVDQVVIKQGGVYNGKAIGNEIMLQLNGEAVHQLHALLVLDELNAGFYCMCSGDYAIELIAGHEIKATIGFHHGVSIRYDGWRSDVALGKPGELLDFFAAHGFTAPLKKREADRRRDEEWATAKSKWFENAPKCFAKYRLEMSGFDEAFYPALLSDLQAEIPNKEARIIALLQCYGYSQSPWTAYPMYEDVPYKILSAVPFTEIIAAYIACDRNYKTRRGLGRYICCFDFRKIWRKKAKYITPEVIADLEKYFIYATDAHGMEKLLKLKELKHKQHHPL